MLYRTSLLVLAMLAAPAFGQTVATLPVTCNAASTICTQATPVTNPDGSLIGASGSSTRTTAAGTSDTQAIPVQGVTNGVPESTISRGGGNFTTAQIPVATTATLIAAARSNRQRITVVVTTAVQCSYGNAGVTLTTGFPLQAVAGASATFDTSVALYGVCASAATVGEVELY